MLYMLSVLFLISPFVVYWVLHGDYERYLWIINQSYPLSHLGSFGYQATLYGALFLIGVGVLLLALGTHLSRRFLTILGAVVIGVALIGCSVVLLSQSPYLASEKQASAQPSPLADFSLSDEFKEKWNVSQKDGNSVNLGKDSEDTRYEITMNVITINKDPREWIEQHVHYDDGTALDYEWGFVNDVQQLRVDWGNVDDTHGLTLSNYLLGEGRVVVMTQNPLDTDYDTGRLYSILMHTDAYYLIDPAYSRSILRENCQQDVSDKFIDDMLIDKQHETALLYWTNYDTNENQRLFVAYEPDTGFAGCSASVTILLADRRDAARFSCPNDYQFTMIYLGEENNEALLQLPSETHRVSIARSGSGARYINEDKSVVFWEHQGEATLEKAGETVREQCVVSNT